MSTEEKVSGGQPDQNSGGKVEGKETPTTVNSGGTTSDNKGDDKVAYSTFMKSVDEKKALQQRLEQEEQARKEAELKLAEAEGNKDEIIAKWKAEAEENNQKLQALIAERDNEKASRAQERINSQVREAATKMGCLDVDYIVDKIDVSKLDVDQNLKVGDESLNAILGGFKEKRPALFSNPKPPIHDGAVSSDPNNRGGANIYGNMNDQQAFDAFKNDLKQFGGL